MELKKKQTKRLVLNQSFVSQNATFWLNDNIFNFGTQLKSEGLHFGLQLSMKYYKLFDLLSRRDMKKTDLLEVISAPTLAKLSKGESVTTDVLCKICAFLDCQPGDIMEYVK